VEPCLARNEEVSRRLAGQAADMKKWKVNQLTVIIIED
jgi:hypothetical protein